MNVFQFLKSLDDLLYEVVSWLVFFPLTLWRALVRPLAMMRRARAEVAVVREDRFDDVLSPPLLLLMTILATHVLELALIGQSVIVTRDSGLATLIDDDTSLILLRMVAFSTFPLIFALRSVRAQGVRLSRKALEPEFFAQSYANAPYGFALSIAATLGQVPSAEVQIAAGSVAGVAVIAFLAIETAWFRALLGTSFWRAFGQALRAYVEAGLILLLLAALLGAL